MGSFPLPPIDFDDDTAGRILATAREILLRDRYSGLTMDNLAFALGMSKKTLYIHFPSKDAIGSAIIAITGKTIRREAQELIESSKGFAEKLEGLLRLVATHLSVLRPDFLQDLQRFAPHLRRELDGMKERNIPLLFGRVLSIGLEQGMVRPDIDVTFLIEYWLQVIKGMHDPEVLRRTGLTPREAFEKAVELFFCGLLTPAGRTHSRWGRKKSPAAK